MALCAQPDGVFNELSAPVPGASASEMDELMSGVIDALKLFLQSGRFRHPLRTTPNFRQLPLSEETTVEAWSRRHLSDRRGELYDKARLLLSLSSKPPFVPELAMAARKARETAERVDVAYPAAHSFACGGRALAIGLGYCALGGHVALSLAYTPWDGESLIVRAELLREELEMLELAIPNASTEDSARGVLDLIRESEAPPRSGREFFQRVETGCFRNLTLTSNAKGQVRKLTQGDHIAWFWEVLQLLNDRAERWDSGEFMTPELRARTSAVNENPPSGRPARFERERTFACPDGESRYMGWHARAKGAFNRRVHFYAELALVDVGQRPVLVGHVGGHLWYTGTN